MRRNMFFSMIVVISVMLMFFDCCQSFSTTMPRRSLPMSVRSMQAIKFSPFTRSIPPLSLSSHPTLPKWNAAMQHGLQEFSMVMNVWMTQFWRYMRRAISAFIVAASSFSGSLIPGSHMRRQLAVAGGLTAITTMSVPRPAQASMFKKYRDLTPVQKLATTPVFFVCNSGGSPYLQDDVQAGKPEQKIVIYFMSSEDANDYMNEIAQGNPQNINEFRVMAVSMEKVMKKIQSKKQSRKLGRYKLQSVIRIQPSTRQCDNAEAVVTGGGSLGSSDGKGGKGSTRATSALKGVSIPMFHAKGMSIQRGNGEIVVPYYFALEDLREDWNLMVEEARTQEEDAAMAASSGKSTNSIKSSKQLQLPAKPKVEVADFVDVMCGAQGLNPETLRMHLAGPSATDSSSSSSSSSDVTISTGDSATTPKSSTKRAQRSVGIVPPRREIEMIRRYYRNEAGIKNEFQEARIMGSK